MDYIVLGRQLDKIAREDGYTCMSDDIIGLILEYTGRIDYKPTFMYQIEVKFYYDIWSRRRLMMASDSDSEDEEEYKPKLLTKDKIGYNYYYYCGCCDRIYSSYKTHMDRLKHKHNRDKKGDLCKDVKGEVISRTLVKYALSSRHRNTRIRRITMKDVWRLRK